MLYTSVHLSSARTFCVNKVMPYFCYEDETKFIQNFSLVHAHYIIFSACAF